MHNEILESSYEKALEKVISNSLDMGGLNNEDLDCICKLVDRAESNKGLITVLTTLLVHKICYPTQDIRYHQAQQKNGFAGRTIDQKYVTPFMKKLNFPAMSESGWLTRSLEQPHPYTLDYPGKITPDYIKKSFLEIIDNVQVKNKSAEDYLQLLFIKLIEQRDKMNISLAKPHDISISRVVEILEKHFTYSYNCAGASRLPTLAIYAAYECAMSQIRRFDNKNLCNLESHTSSDHQSGKIGDIQINNADGTAFEGVEIKHLIIINRQMIADAYEKFKIYGVDRYYVLTTANMDVAEWDEIEAEIYRIQKIHGCQVIVNGVYSTIRYYLRLFEDPAEFISRYVEAMRKDETIKFQHKIVWNDIISGNIT